MNTRSHPADGSPADADPIVRVAVLRFARDGFGAPLRQVAADAGVSAALLVKRYGSKDGLRAACDDLVLAWIRRAKTENVDAVEDGRFLARLAASDEHAPLVVYVMRSVMEGGTLGRDFVEHMIADAEQYTADAVERGLMRPSRDPSARARYLVMSSIGAFLLSLLLHPADDTDDLAAVSRRLQAESMLPMLELFTEGVFATQKILDDYLRFAAGEGTAPRSGAGTGDTVSTDTGKDGSE